MLDIKKMNFSDGEIKKLISEPGQLKVLFKDWREDEFVLCFTNLISFASYGAEGETVSSLLKRNNSEFINMVSSTFQEEDFNHLVEYCFVSAWSEVDILCIICENVEICPN